MQKRNTDKLQHAMRSLENAISYAQSNEFQGLGLEFKSVLISAVAQNFHLTFAVCCQMISLQLAEHLGKEVAQKVSSEELFRMAAKEGMITRLDRWLEYLNIEHPISVSTNALRAFEKAASFLEDASELLRTCASRSHNERRRAA